MGNCLSNSQQTPPPLQNSKNNNQIIDSSTNIHLVSTNEPSSLQPSSHHTPQCKQQETKNQLIKVIPIITSIPLQTQPIQIKQNPQDMLQCDGIQISQSQSNQPSQKIQNVIKDKDEVIDDKCQSQGQKIIVGSTNSVILGAQKQNNSQNSQIFCSSSFKIDPTLSQMINADKNNSKRSSQLPFQLVYSQSMQGSQVIQYRNKQVEKSKQTMEQTFPFQLIEQPAAENVNHEKQYQRRHFQQSTIIIQTRVQPKQQISQNVEVVHTT